MLAIGNRVKVSVNNDNENYDEFRGKVLIVEEIYLSEEDHMHYDYEQFSEDPNSNGMQLVDLTTEEDGEDVPFSLYEYELEML